MAARDPRTGVLAIDPGVNGAYASFLPNGDLWKVDDLPRFASGLDAVSIANEFRSLRPSTIIIEREASRPGEGVASVFSFGCAYGIITGVAACCGAPFHLVSPSVWKKHQKLIGRPKDASRELAVRLYPVFFQSLQRKKDHNRAEAILLGNYALDQILKPPPAPEPAAEIEEELVI